MNITCSHHEHQRGTFLEPLFQDLGARIRSSNFIPSQGRAVGCCRACLRVRVQAFRFFMVFPKFRRSLLPAVFGFCRNVATFQKRGQAKNIGLATGLWGGPAATVSASQGAFWHTRKSPNCPQLNLTTKRSLFELKSLELELLQSRGKERSQNTIVFF